MNAVLVAGVAASAYNVPVLVRRFTPAIVHRSVQIPDWTTYASVGQRVGPAMADVTITEFGDFECPLCAQTALQLQALRARYGDRVAIVYRHYPIRTHPYARAAAAAAECASEQVAFDRVSQTLFAHQDELGKRSWGSFASEMGVRDTGAFQRCLTTSRPGLAVERDMDAALSLGVNSTPTILVNDQRILGAPNAPVIESLVDSMLRVAPVRP